MDETIDDVANGVRALQTAVDALAMIARLGGVQGDWAMDALREVKHTLFDAPMRPALALVSDPFEAALGESRR